MQTTSFGRVVLIADSVVFKSAEKNMPNGLGEKVEDL